MTDIINQIIHHDVRRPWPIPDGVVDCIVTSPPYWGLRDYKHKNQIGQETSPEEYVETMLHVFREAHRVLKDSGTLWLNLGDTYWGGKGQSGGAWQGDNINGKAINIAKKGETRPQDRTHPFIKPKDLVGIPWSVALALRNDGWYLRQDIIWNKPNPMPASMTDRCTTSHEYIFLLSKSKQYYFDQEAIKVDMVDYEMERRKREKLQGMTGKKKVGRDGKIGLADQSQNGAVRDREALYALMETGKANKKSVWTVTTKGYDGDFCTACRRYYEGSQKNMIRVETVIENGKEKERSICLCGRHDAWIEHFATFPPDLIVDCIKAGAPAGGLVLDPFSGAATTALVSLANGRNFIGLEVNPDYVDLGRHRLRHEFGMFFTL